MKVTFFVFAIVFAQVVHSTMDHIPLQETMWNFGAMRSKCTFHRLGVPHDVVFPFDHATTTELLEFVRVELQDPSITRLLSMEGISLDAKAVVNMENDCEMIAMAQQEKFFWPGKHVGHQVLLPAGENLDRDVSLTTVSISPRVFVVGNLLSDEEADVLVRRAKRRLHMAQVDYDNGTLGVNPIRTSKHADFKPVPFYRSTLTILRERIANVTRMPLFLEEDLQVIYYQVGQHYYAHFDYLRNGNEVLPVNRLITLVLYLSDVEEGGETVFPLTNPKYTMESKDDYCSPTFECLKVKPLKGTAAMFYNLLEKGHLEGIPDVLTLHAGCDVIKGEKWAGNQWLWNSVP